MPFDSPVIARLSRPKLLARAARAGMAVYRRDRDLPFALRQKAMTGDLLDALMSAEAKCDADRRAGAPGYSATRHVKLLSALLAEARAATA